MIFYAPPWFVRKRKERREIKHGVKDFLRGLKAFRSEKYPGQIDKVEGNEPGEEFVECNTGLAPQTINKIGHAVQYAPDNKGPGRAVPQATE